MATMLDQQQHFTADFRGKIPVSPSDVFAVKRSQQPAPSSIGAVPHRLTVLPVYETTFDNLSGDDRNWWNTQNAAFSSAATGGGLPAGLTFGLIVYEAMNFMDGKRTTSDIANLLSAEYNHDFDAVWMDRLVSVLGRLQLVGAK